MSVQDVGISILASVIYDISKKVFSNFVDKRKQIDPLEYVKANINRDYLCFFETNGVEDFLKQPQVSDTITSYIAYVINGVLSENLKKIYKEKSRSFPLIEENEVINYLANCFKDSKLDKVVTINIDEVKGAFKHIFTLANNYFISFLSLESKVEIFAINRRIISSFLLLDGKIERYVNLIKGMIKLPLVDMNEDYDTLRVKYMNILKSRHNKALIYLLDEFDLDRFYIPPALALSGKEKRLNVVHILSSNLEAENSLFSQEYLVERWEDIFIRDNIAYITGGAGYGKSLLMKNIIINYDKLNINSSTEHIVIYGEIKWFIKKDGTLRSMTEFLIECINNCTLERVEEEFVNYHLSLGRCILLLDSLDEVPMDKRRELHRTIMAHLRNINPNNKVCITSRDRGFIPVEDDIEHFSILPLSSRHIEMYVDKIIKLGKFNKHDKEPFLRQAIGLVDKKFLSSFLVLSLLINIYKGERELPETKQDLYQKCLEYISNKREKQKTDENFDWKLISPLMKDNTFIELSLLCFPNNKEVKESEACERLCDVYQDTFYDKATLINAVSEFLKFCSERTELFVPANLDSTFRFFHRSFFEYFYSKYIVLRSKDSSEIYSKLLQFDIDSEVFELTLSRLRQDTQDKYTDLIRFVINKATEEISNEVPTFKALNVLTLFFQLADEIIFQQKLIEIIIVYKDKIVKNIDKIANQEVILNVILRLSKEDEIISTYEESALADLFNITKSIDQNDLSRLTRLDIVEKDKDKGIFNFASSKFLFSSYSHRTIDKFYSILVMRKYSFSSILNNLIQKLSLTSKHKKRVRGLIKFYESRDQHDKEKIDGLLCSIYGLEHI